jgi:hypothetical protein
MTLVISKGITLRNQLPADAEADAYIAAVEAADASAGQTGGLEPGVKFAIKNFVLCCKQDGIWDAIKASCILAGARTLNGALIPLVGTAPTNVGGLFVSGDYNRKTGLVGNGSTKYLDSNRNHLSDPQNNVHISTFVGVGALGTQSMIGMSGGGVDDGRELHIFTNTAASVRLGARNRHGGTSFTLTGNTTISGFIGTSRNSSSFYSVRYESIGATNSITSGSSATAGNHYIFGRNLNNTVNLPSAQRIAFYSIGESLDLALLDARVTDLINAFAAAIP